MAKLLVAVAAFSTLGYLAYFTLYKTKVESMEDRVAHAPKRSLDNVRTKAKEMEKGDQERNDAIDAKTAE